MYIILGHIPFCIEQQTESSFILLVSIVQVMRDQAKLFSPSPQPRPPVPCVPEAFSGQMGHIIPLVCPVYSSKVSIHNVQETFHSEAFRSET